MQITKKKKKNRDREKGREKIKLELLIQFINYPSPGISS